MVAWVREDWDMGIRAYEEPQNTPAPTTAPTSSGNSGNSGSGNSGSTTEPTGSTYVPSDVTPAPTTTQPTSAPTEPTSAPTQPTSAPTEPTSAPTETQATQPTSAPTETTPAPTETEKYITHYEFNGNAYDDADNCYSFSCTGSSYQNCIDQFYTWCDNHGYYPGNYNCAAVWSDGSMTYA